MHGEGQNAIWKVKGISVEFRMDFSAQDNVPPVTVMFVQTKKNGFGRRAEVSEKLLPPLQKQAIRRVEQSD